MSHPPPRLFWQFRLSSLLVGTVVGGVMLFVNLALYPSYEGISYGWPFAVRTYDSEQNARSLNPLAAVGDLLFALAFVAMAVGVLELFVRLEKRPWMATAATLVTCSWPLMVALDGYNAYMRYGWLIALPVSICFCMAMLSARRRVIDFVTTPDELRQSRLKYLYAVTLCVLIFCGSWFGGNQIRRVHCQSVCNAVEQLIVAVEVHRTKQGSYPTADEIKPELDALAKNAGITVQRRKLLTSGSFDVEDMYNADVTMYLNSDECTWIVPIERPFILSITRFSVYIRSTSTHSWQEDRMLWTVEPK